MRPVLLEMNAFGPFPGKEQIWFEHLGANPPLFLINGPTGSGKTTILDAICFALYGKSTGDEREGSQMRSDLAMADTMTEITLVFDLADKRYRIVRIPEQQRPKSRGEGFTVQAAQAVLCEIESSGEERLLVSSKVTEATAEIERLTGLNADQFRQVMVLPQGKFRQMLMAESKDREQIFSKLFQTQVYKKLEEILKQQAAEIKREVEEIQSVNRGILESADVDSVEALETELEKLIPGLEQALDQKRLTDKAHLDAVNLLQAARSLTDQFNQLAATQKTLESLNKQQADVGLKRRQKATAELAQTLLPVLKDVDRCRSDSIRTQEKLKQLEQEKNQAKVKLESAELNLKGIETLSTQLDQLKQELTSLTGFRERSQNLSKIRQDLAAAEKAEKKALERLQAADKTLADTISLREKIAADYKQMQQSQTLLSQKQLDLKELSIQLTNRIDLEEKRKKQVQLQKQIATAERKGKKLADEAQKAESELKALEVKWHMGQAAMLAATLQTDLPCPVCGSREHPAPAQSTEALPTDAELEGLRELCQKLRNQLTTARESFAGVKNDDKNLQVEIDKTAEKLGEYAEVPVSSLNQQCEALSAEVTSLQQQQKQMNKLASQIEEKQKVEQTDRKSVAEAQQYLAEQREKLAGIRARETDAARELPEAYRQPGELEKSIVNKQAEIKQQDQKITRIRTSHQEALSLWNSTNAAYQSAVEANINSEKQQQAAQAIWEAALQKSEFEAESDFRKALLSDAERKALAEEIDRFDALLSRTQGALEQQQAALKDQIKPDLAECELVVQKRLEEKTATEAQWQGLNNRVAQLSSTRKKLAKAETERETLETRYALIGTLSNLANGLTGNKVSLQRFVLSVLLDDVLVGASQRLSLMSKGRYQLLRKEDRTKGNKASGLELEVADAYSGKVRPVATLSGGESFMAALALALGLSDVVQAYAGGIKLDTLFIDEGFGSLDQESLDLAIRTLVDLQSSGRMIGIISHVSDLREQMTTRIDILPDQKGSRIRLVAE